MTEHLCDIDSEYATIGALLLEPIASYSECADVGLVSECFTVSQLRAAWDTIVAMIGEGLPCDLLTVQAEMKKRCPMQDYDLSRCVDVCVAPAHIRYYAKLLYDKFMVRSVRAVGDFAYSITADVQDTGRVVADLQDKVLGLSLARTNTAKPSEIVKAKREQWVQAFNGKPIGLTMPWDKFYQHTGGPRKGHVCVVASRKGMGKSTFINNWVLHLGKCKIPCAYLPLEDGAEIAWGRIAASYGQFSLYHLDNGKSSEAQIEIATQHLEAVSKMPIYINDNRMNCADIFAFASQMKLKHGIEAIFIDGFKDISRERKGEEVSEDNTLSAHLCDMARKLDIVVVCVHHIKKRPSQERNDDYDVDDIRGSGRIVDDARSVLALQPEPFESDDFSAPRPYRLVCQRNNHGPCGFVRLTFVMNTSTFLENAT